VPVNSGVAQASNALLVLTIVVYALAMLAYAGDFAFGKRKTPAPVPARLPELVGAGAPAGFDADAGHTFPADPSDLSELADLSVARRIRPERLARVPALLACPRCRVCPRCPIGVRAGLPAPGCATPSC